MSNICHFKHFNLISIKGPWVKQSETETDREGATGGDYMETVETDTQITRI